MVMGLINNFNFSAFYLVVCAFMLVFAAYKAGFHIGVLRERLNIHILADKIPDKCTRYIKKGRVYAIIPIDRGHSYKEGYGD